MSWDVILVPNSVKSAEAIDSQTLGPKRTVIHQLKSVFPDINLSDLSWGTVDRRNYSIEFNFGEDNPSVQLMLHIRGNEEVIEALRALCDSSSWRAFDTTTGDFIDFERDPARGLNIWRGFRDQVASIVETESSLAKKKKAWWQFWR